MAINGLTGSQLPPWLQQWLASRGALNNTTVPETPAPSYTNSSVYRGAKGLFDESGSDATGPYDGLSVSLDPGSAEVSGLISASMASKGLSAFSQVMPGMGGLMLAGAGLGLDAARANAERSVLGSYYPGANSLGGVISDTVNDLFEGNNPFNDGIDDGGISMEDSYNAGGTTTGGFRSDGTPFGGSVYSYAADDWVDAATANAQNMGIGPNPYGETTAVESLTGIAGLLNGLFSGAPTYYGGPQTKEEIGAFITDENDSYYDGYKDANGNLSYADQIAFGFVDGIDPSEASRYAAGGDLDFGRAGTGWHLTGPGEVPDVAFGLHTSNGPAGYYGAENMSVSDYTDSAAQAADIAAAQAAFDNDASSGDGGWDGEGGGWGGGWGADDGGEGGFDDGGWW